MAVTVMEMVGKLEANTSGFDRGMRRSEGLLHGFGRRAGGHFARFLKAGVGAAVGVGVAFAGMAIYKGGQRAVAIDDANRKLSGLGYNAKQVAAITDQALKSVLGTPYSLAQALNVASTAMAAGVKPGQQLSKYLGTVGDAASVAGTSLDDMGAILNKATANVKVHADVLNQLADRGLPVFSWLQKEYKVSGEALTKMVKQGKVDADTLLKVIRDHLGGAALKAGEGLRGSFSNLMTAVARLGDAFVGPIFGSLPGFFTFLRDKIDDITPAVRRFGEGFAQAIKAIAPTIHQVMGVISDFAAGLGGGGSGSIADAGWKMRQIIVGQVIPALQAMWSFIKDHLIPFALQLKDVFVGAFENIAAVVRAHEPELRRIWERVQAAVQAMAPIVIALLKLVFQQILPRVIAVAIVAIDIFTGAIEGVVKAGLFMRNALRRAWTAVKDAVLNAVTSVLGTLKLFLRGLALIMHAAGKMPGPLGAPFRAAADAIDKAIAKVDNLQHHLNNLKSKTIHINAVVHGLGYVAALQEHIALMNSKTVYVGAKPKQHGGPVSAGSPYLVGERGPELFVPRMSGSIVPNAAMAGGGNTYIIQGPILERDLLSLFKKLDAQDKRRGG
jgi:tape measure domain-containing protein